MGTKDGDEDAEKHEQVNLADAAEEGEETLHEVRAKVLKFVSPEDAAETRGHVALNRSVMPDFTYKAEEKYVKITTGNATGDGLETWMIQVKTKDLAKALADKVEEHKG